MASPIRWGVIGTGRIASDFATALSHVEGAQFVAVGSRNLESAKSFASKFGFAKSYASYEAVATDPDVQVVYVSTLHPLHKENTLVCLKNKKAVLCEKPFTLNAKETEEIIQCARENKVFLMEAMWSRFLPAYEKIRQLISSGTLGEISLVLADFGFRNLSTPRLMQPELGGGALLDVGIYPVSITSLAFGGQKPSNIQSNSTLHSTGVDIQFGALIGYKHGQLGIVSSSFLGDLPNEVKIIGSKGRVTIHNPMWCATKITITLNEKQDEVLEFPMPPAKEGSTFNFTNSIGLQFEARHVMKMLREGKIESDVMSLDESLTIMKTLDTLRNQMGFKYPTEK